jgi:hypothetical protein
MTSSRFALLAGIVYILVGVLGFVPGIVQPPPAEAPALAVPSGYGYLLGLFPINILHNVVHLLIGVWGYVASRTAAGARTFAQSLTVFYGLLAVMGLVPGFDTTLGLIPIFGHDVWLHAATAIVAAYFGFATRTPSAA